MAGWLAAGGRLFVAAGLAGGARARRAEALAEARLEKVVFFLVGLGMLSQYRYCA